MNLPVHRVAVSMLLVLATLCPVTAQQAERPRAEVTPVAEATTVRAGETVSVSLKVRLPADVHVQANKPRDPSLIPTVLAVEAPSGVTVEGIAYPPPADLTQSGRVEPLAVLGPEFAIDVRLAIAESAAPGELIVPAVLRYQACNASVCFPPARATTEWRLAVMKGEPDSIPSRVST